MLPPPSLPPSYQEVPAVLRSTWEPAELLFSIPGFLQVEGMVRLGLNNSSIAWGYLPIQPDSIPPGLRVLPNSSDSGGKGEKDRGHGFWEAAFLEALESRG